MKRIKILSQYYLFKSSGTDNFDRLFLNSDYLTFPFPDKNLDIRT